MTIHVLLRRQVFCELFVDVSIFAEQHGGTDSASLFLKANCVATF